MTTRRQLITGLICFVAAPAIVRASSLMPVKQMHWRLLNGGRDVKIMDPLIVYPHGDSWGYYEILRVDSDAIAQEVLERIWQQNATLKNK